MTFGTPSGNARIAAQATDVPPDPPMARMASKRRSAYNRGAKRGRPATHRGHRASAVFRGHHRAEIFACGRRHFFARHIGRDHRWTQDTDIHQQHLMAALLNTLSHECVLRSLRIQCAQECNRAHGEHPSRLAIGR